MSIPSPTPSRTELAEEHHQLQREAVQIEGRLVILDDLLAESGGNPRQTQPPFYVASWAIDEHFVDWNVTITAWVAGRDTPMRIRLTLDEAALMAQRLADAVERQKASQERVAQRNAGKQG